MEFMRGRPHRRIHWSDPFYSWEAVVVAADVAMKSADVQIGFMDRFCGSLIITGGLSQVQTAVEEVVRFFDRELGFKTCAVHRS